MNSSFSPKKCGNPACNNIRYKYKSLCSTCFFNLPSCKTDGCNKKVVTCNEFCDSCVSHKLRLLEIARANREAEAFRLKQEQLRRDEEQRRRDEEEQRRRDEIKRVVEMPDAAFRELFFSLNEQLNTMRQKMEDISSRVNYLEEENFNLRMIIGEDKKYTGEYDETVYNSIFFRIRDVEKTFRDFKNVIYSSSS